MTTFEYIAVFVSIIVALGVAQILSGVARMIERPEGQKIYPVHLPEGSHLDRRAESGLQDRVHRASVFHGPGSPGDLVRGRNLGTRGLNPRPNRWGRLAWFPPA